MRRSTRPDCPYCGKEGLTDRIGTVPYSKLDNGDPAYRQFTICVLCKKIVYVVDNGLNLEPGFYNVR
jgi:hypothetical protein